MPTFIDYHPVLPPLPPEASAAIAERIRAGEPDDFGVRPINILFGTGDCYCLTDAPDVDAVLASHDATGLPIARAAVKQITSLV